MSVMENNAIHPGLIEAALAEALAVDLSLRPSLFGRVLYMAGYWRTETDSYEHPFSQNAGPEATDRILRILHLDLMTRWFSLPLNEKVLDIEQYLTASKERGPALAGLLRAAEKAMSPESLPPERESFLQDAALVRCLLSNQSGSWYKP